MRTDVSSSVLCRFRSACRVLLESPWRLEEAELARSGFGGVTVFGCVLDGSRDDVNLLCICRPCDEGLPGAGSRAEAVEHAAFCLRGREVSSIAVFGVLHE